jgi:hypothetical protein
MGTGQYCALLSSVFAGGLIAYQPTARQNGWPVGSIFEKGVVPTAVYLGVMAWLFGVGAAWTWHGRASWWWLLWTFLSSLFGGAFIAPIFRTWSGAVSLMAAPTLALACAFV